MSARLDVVLDKEVWKAFGAVSTPTWIVDLMIRLLDVDEWRNLKILEPGSGLCNFLARIYEQYPANAFTGVEINPEVYAMARSLYPQFTLYLADFILWDAAEEYDVVIGNPPYGIIGDKSHYPLHVLREKKAAYKRVCTTWFGKYNLYGAFIEKGLKVLGRRGKLAFIVPATFMILDEFKQLRKLLAASGRVKVFYLGNRMFEGKSVSTCLLVVEKARTGLELHEVLAPDNIATCYEKDRYGGEMIRFESSATKALEEKAIPLGALFDIYFAARSPEIKKHPLVSREPKPGLVPILTGRNLHAGYIDYTTCYSQLWMPKEAAPSLRWFYKMPHLVVAHTKGGKVVAAVDRECYPWREDIHLIPKVEGVDIDEVAAYLNSEEVQAYMRALYRDITPHITITQLRQLPLRVGWLLSLDSLHLIKVRVIAQDLGAPPLLHQGDVVGINIINGQSDVKLKNAPVEAFMRKLEAR